MDSVTFDNRLDDLSELFSDVTLTFDDVIKLEKLRIKRYPHFNLRDKSGIVIGITTVSNNVELQYEAFAIKIDYNVNLMLKYRFFLPVVKVFIDELRFDSIFYQWRNFIFVKGENQKFIITPSQRIDLDERKARILASACITNQYYADTFFTITEKKAYCCEMLIDRVALQLFCEK
ncbi:MAG TPA: hypothetical protein ENO30_06565 [Thermodesulfobium narugense]|nr:hypothetical protein [Thermodesulfobium narugense]